MELDAESEPDEVDDPNIFGPPDREIHIEALYDPVPRLASHGPERRLSIRDRMPTSAETGREGHLAVRFLRVDARERVVNFSRRRASTGSYP